MTTTEISQFETSAPSRGQRIAEWARSSGILIALVLLIVLFGVLKPQQFLSLSNLSNVLDQIAILGIVAIAQTIIMVVGDFDLSVGAVASLAGIVVGTLLGMDTPIGLAIVVAVLIGAAVGLVNGSLVVGFKLSAFVVTLATMTTVSGVAFTVTNGGPVFGFPPDFTWFGQARLGGFPVLAIFAVVVSIAALVTLRWSVVGRKWYAIGGNPEVARLSGLSVGRLRVVAFAIGGAIAAIGGVLLASRLGSSTPTSGDSYTLLSVAAVFLGMTLSRQGIANVGGTLIGVGLLGVLSNGLSMVGVSTFLQQILTGIIIVASVTVSRFTRVPR